MIPGGKASVVAVAGLLAMACSRGPVAPGPSRAMVPHNVVIVCIDALRADHVGTYGYVRRTTPNIDAVAAGGALFERATAQSNWTVPATASLLTGVYPSDHGAGIRGRVRSLDVVTAPNPIGDDVEILSESLHARGFRTGLFSANPFLYGSFTRGFDVARVNRRNATRLTDAAIRWLRKSPAARTFLYLQYMDTHHPLHPPEPYYSRFVVPGGGRRGSEHENWAYGQQRDLQAPAFRDYRAHKLALYDGALSFVDAEVGRLLATLRELGMEDDTLIVITSDHGEEFWDHAEIESRLGGDPRGIWGIGHGHSMFEELLHVPLIVRTPGVKGARRVPCAVRHIDVVPTVLDLLGQSAPPSLRGRSLRELLEGRTPACPELPQIAESPAYGPDSRSITWGETKLVAREDGVRLLFDLGRDPAEREDLSSARPQLADRLHEELERRLHVKRSRPKPTASAYDPETARQLRALGYLE
jgi:arylsulfatase A-like enzyme